MCETGSQCDKCNQPKWSVHWLAQVLYLDVIPDDGADTLQRLAQHVRQHMGNNGIEIDQGRGAFTPHVTVAKLSALNGNARRNIRSIPQVGRASAPRP